MMLSLANFLNVIAGDEGNIEAETNSNVTPPGREWRLGRQHHMSKMDRAFAHERQSNVTPSIRKVMHMSVTVTEAIVQNAFQHIVRSETQVKACSLRRRHRPVLRANPSRGAPRRIAGWAYGTREHLVVCATLSPTSCRRCPWHPRPSKPAVAGCTATVAHQHAPRKDNHC
jgi:hypothetical protein